MRTTRAIDDDVIEGARLIAAGEGRSPGAVIPALARRSLRPTRRGLDAAFPEFDVADAANGWATTPVTECGFVRVSSHRRALPTSTSPARAGRLVTLDRSFLPSPSIRTSLRWVPHSGH